MKGEKGGGAPNPLEPESGWLETGASLPSAEDGTPVPQGEHRAPGEAGKGAVLDTDTRKAGDTSASTGGAAGCSEAGGAFSFEQGLKRLEEIVQLLEKEDVPLEESLKLWEEGAALVRKLEEILDRAQARIEQVLRDEGGRIYTIPVEREPG